MTYTTPEKTPDEPTATEMADATFLRLNLRADEEADGRDLAEGVIAGLRRFVVSQLGTDAKPELEALAAKLAQG